MANLSNIENINQDNPLESSLSEYHFSELVDWLTNAEFNDIKKYYCRIHSLDINVIDNDKNTPWSDNFHGFDGCCSACNDLFIALALCKEKKLNKATLKHFPRI